MANGAQDELGLDSGFADDGAGGLDGPGGPGLRVALVAALSAVTIIAVEGIGRRLPVPARSDCGKCSDYGDVPHGLAKVGYPVLACFAGMAVIAAVLAAARVARRWELFTWLVPLVLLGILFLRYVQHMTSGPSVSQDTLFPLDAFWTIADGAVAAACAVPLAVLTDERFGAPVRRLVSRIGAAVMACGFGYWLWALFF